MSVTPLYCTDEAIIRRASRDYALLVPEHAKLAVGTDGSFAASDRWTLATSVPLQAQGVAAGHAVILSQPGTRSSRFGEAGEVAIVDSVSAAGAVLRRPGFPAGQGEPIGAVGGTTGATFWVTTVSQQVEDVSYRINKLYGIDRALALRSPDDLYDLREVEDLCALMVLKRLCFDAWRNDRQKGDLWLDKGKCYEAEVNELIPAIVVHWGPHGDSQPATTALGTRISR